MMASTDSWGSTRAAIALRTHLFGVALLHVHDKDARINFLQNRLFLLNIDDLVHNGSDRKQRLTTMRFITQRLIKNVYYMCMILH